MLLGALQTWDQHDRHLDEVSRSIRRLCIGVCRSVLYPFTTRSYVLHILTLSLWSQKSGWQKSFGDSFRLHDWASTLTVERNVVGWWGPVWAAVPNHFLAVDTSQGKSPLCQYAHFWRFGQLLVGWNVYRPYFLFRKPWQYDLENFRAKFLLFPRSPKMVSFWKISPASVIKTHKFITLSGPEPWSKRAFRPPGMYTRPPRWATLTWSPERRPEPWGGSTRSTMTPRRRPWKTWQELEGRVN